MYNLFGQTVVVAEYYNLAQRTTLAAIGTGGVIVRDGFAPVTARGDCFHCGQAAFAQQATFGAASYTKMGRKYAYDLFQNAHVVFNPL